MLSPEEDAEAHALRRRGWTISAIARHIGRSRITVRAYLNGDRVPGVRRRAAADPFAPFVEYVSAAALRPRPARRAPCCTDGRWRGGPQSD